MYAQFECKPSALMCGTTRLQYFLPLPQQLLLRCNLVYFYAKKSKTEAKAESIQFNTSMH